MRSTIVFVFCNPINAHPAFWRDFTMISKTRDILSKEDQEQRAVLSPAKRRKVQFTGNEEEHNLTTLRGGRVYSLSPASSPRKPSRRAGLRPASDISPHVKRSLAFGKTSSSSRAATSEGGTNESKRKRKGSSSKDESSKVRVQEVNVPTQTLSNWQPLSDSTRNVFTDVLFACLGPSLNGLPKTRKTRVERELNSILSQVREELKTTTAPAANRTASYSGLTQQMDVLKEKCLSAVKRNSELEERLAERKSEVDTKRSRLQQLSELISTNHVSLSSDENNPQLTSTRTGSEDFSTYLVNVLENGRQKDTHLLYKL